jgi:hypothetical protein
LLALSMAVPVSAQQASPADPVIYLNQAWSQEDREWYYQFSQGSSILPYDIFLNLEVAGGQELFRSDANSERYGLIGRRQIRSSTRMVFRSVSARLRWALLDGPAARAVIMQA